MNKIDYVLIDKKSTFIDKKVKIGTNVIIYENNRIEGDTVIGDNVTVFPNSFIANSIIGKGSKIYSSFIENCKIGDCCIVGPFSYLKKSVIENGTKIPAYSEIYKKTINKKYFENLSKWLKKASIFAFFIVILILKWYYLFNIFLEKDYDRHKFNKNKSWIG